MPAPDSPLRALLQANKADPEGAPIWTTDMTVDEARSLFDAPGAWEGLDIMDQLDEAQGHVTGGDVDEPEAFLLIRIRRA